MNTQTRIALLAGLAVILVGCKSDKKSVADFHDPFFPPDNVTPPSKKISNTQFANGAAADGMLFDIHFDGAELNSLGAEKLKLMVQGKPAHSPLKVFLNMPKDATDSTARQTAVEKSLADAGLLKDKFAVSFGPNPGVLMPADAGIRALSPLGAAAPAATPSAGTTATAASIAH